jgi:hypothetical protein
MVITELAAADVLQTTRMTLGLGPSSGKHIDDALLAALVRRAAGVLCPSATVTLVSAVVDALRLLTQDSETLKKRATTAVDNLIVFGDLLELNQVTVDDPAVKSTWVFAAPPSFVARPSGTIFILGVVADEVSALPASLNERITHEGFTRILTPRTGEDLPASLRSIGLREISLRIWRKSPPLQPAAELLDQILGHLNKQPESGAIADIRILDPARNARFYDQRWITPHGESGTFVARRPQAYGAPLWGFAQLDEGRVTRFLDFPLKGQRWRGCDIAWHLQMAIDFCRSTPQRYRKRPIAGGICFDFFAPLPQWASRGLAVIGQPVVPENSLISYWIPEREAKTEEEFLTTQLWLSAIDE